MDYSNLQDWEINVLADRAGLSVEEWKAEQDAMGKPLGNTGETPLVGPQLPPAGDSSSGDISLESPKTERLGRFTRNDQTYNVLESDYIKLQQEQPETYTLNFDDYIKARSGVITETAIMPEVKVTGQAEGKARKAIDRAKDKDIRMAKINAEAVKGNIGVSYFGLAKGFDGNYYVQTKEGAGDYDNGSLFIPSEEDIVDFLGKEKAEKYFNIVEKAGGDNSAISFEDLEKFIDLGYVDGQTKMNAVYAEKQKEAELFDRNYSKEERNEYERFRGDEEFQDEAQKLYLEGKAAALEFSRKFQRPLVRKETIRGVTYDPGAFISVEDWAKGDQPIFGSQIGTLDLTGVSKSQNDKLVKSLNAQVEVADNLAQRWNKVNAKMDSSKGRLGMIEYEMDNILEMENPTEEDLVRFNTLAERYNDIVNSEDYKILIEDWNNLIVETKAHEQLSDDLWKSYDKNIDLAIGNSTALKSFQKIDQLGQVWEEFMLGSGAQLGGQAAYILGKGGEIAFGEDTVFTDIKNLKTTAIDYNKFLSERREQGLGSTLKISDLSRDDISIGDYLTDVVIENSPSITIGTLSGVLGAGGMRALMAKGIEQKIAREVAFKNAGRITGGMFFVSEAGGYLSQTELMQLQASEVLPALEEAYAAAETEQEKRTIQAEIDYYSEINDLGEVQKTFNAIGYGMIANYAERLGTTNFFKNLDKYSKAIGQDRFLALMKNPMAARIASKTAGVTAAAGIGMATEQLEETLTLLGQNMLDIVVGQQDKSLIEGLDADFFANVGVSSLAMTGGGSVRNVYNVVASEFATQAEAREHGKIVDKLFSLQNKLDSGELTLEQTIEARKEKLKILKDLNLLHANSMMKAGDINAGDLKRVFEINQEMRRLKSEAMSIAGDEIGSREKDDFDRIKDNYEALAQEREDILSQPNKTAKDLAKGARNKLEAQFNIRNMMLNDAISKWRYGKGNVFNVQKREEIEEIFKDDEASLKEALSIFDENQNYLAGDTEAGGTNSVIINGKVINFSGVRMSQILMGGIAASRAATSALHELGHAETAAAGIIQNDRLAGNANKLIGEVEALLEKNFKAGRLTQEDYNDVNAIIDSYKSKDYDTTKNIDVSELIELLGDLKARGYIKESAIPQLHSLRTFANAAMKVIAPSYGSMFRFDSANQISNFIDTWHRNAMRGEKSKIAPQATETKQSKALLDEINSLVPDTVQTQADFFDRKVFNPIYNDGNLHPAIANYIRSRSVSKEEAQKIIESVADRLINFNPEATRKSGNAKITFGEFLFSNVNFGKLDARKALFEEGQERSQTESTDSEQARQIAAVEESAPVAERPQYKSLLRRRVLEEDVINNIKSKILSTVRVLKQRLDAPVGKNVTVTPLIAEIKKTMGKQADIDFKKAMGGLKDGELRKFLLRNKAAILENMTTTWLMTAMPNAVQKQVGGVWTSDWKGKKIDRETTSTDNAGRTSGAELVRRMPKVATRMSDADFLSNFFTEDGKLIRGRKESLAKAMAEELTFEIIKEELLDPNSEIGQAFLDNQERQGVEVTENTRAEFVRQAERGNVKFSKALGKINGEFNPNFDLELQGQNQGNALLKLHKLADMEDLRTEKGQDAYLNSLVQELFPLMPKAFFFGPQGGSVFTSSSKLMGSTSKSFPKSQRDIMWNRFQGKIKELSKLDESNFGPAIPGITSFQVKSYTTLMRDVATIQKNLANGEITKFNNQVSKIHRAMWERFAEAVQQSDNKNIARTIMKYMHHGVNNMSHPQRMGAQFVGYSEDFVAGSKTGTFEHAMPNISAYTYLMDAALRGSDFKAAYNAVIGNYKLIALSKESDDKLTGRYKTKMPENWNLLDNTWWERYFNPDVFANDGGIDPNSILTMDGRRFGDAANIKADGTMLTQKAIEFNKGVNIEELTAAKERIKAEQERIVSKKSKGLSKKFNDIVERKTGVESFKTFSRIQAQMRGRTKGRFKFFIAPGADDFRGLVHYAFAGKGKQGEADMKFFEDVLMTPYFKGIAAIDAMRQQIKRDFRVVTKQFREEYKMLGKKIGESSFTYDHALRVYMWNRQGLEVEGLSKRDKKLLLDAIEKNPELVSLADALLVVARRDEWPDPVAHWEGGSVLADLNSMTEKIGRKKFLEEFIQNADEIFTEENLNKIEALYGRKHREAIEDSLYAMKNGTNRPSGANRQVNAWLNWINGSTGAIMFFNRRSALLQMLSFTNFINWSDNNPVKAAAVFANQKQYWKDFAMIFNSDKLKERRGGLKQDVSDSEIADVAGRSKNSPQAILAYLLKIGFTPTQIADSMAIATGGAMFYRNRVNTYLKQGLSQKEAEEKAFLDFSMKSDEAQQSSDPALVSQEQRSVLGRLVLAFANTPMQYTRLMKKAALDLINGRGRPIEHISKIAYYGAIQNFIFSALQSAMFALAFEDDEEELTEAEREKKEKKDAQRTTRVVNSMLDTVLRGSGIYGAVAATIKNAVMEYYKQEDKGFLADHTYTLLAAASISPPIQSKMRKIYSAIQTKRFEKDNVAARGWALTANGKLNLGPNYSILGNVLSGVTNIPMDRMVDELKSISEALDSRNKAWQRIALALGWKTWDVGVRNEEADLIKTTAKEKRKQEGIEKAKETRRQNRKEEEKSKQQKVKESFEKLKEWEEKFVEEQKRKNK